MTTTGPLACKAARKLARVEAAFFDLDKTVIARASMVAFGRPLQRAGLLSRWLVLRALWGQLVYLYLGADEDRMARMRESVLRLTKGWDQEHVSRVVREALDEVIEPIVFDEAIQLIRDHQDAGRKVFIVSASPEEIVAPLARYLEVDEAIATRARIDPDGRYTGEMEFYSYGPHKAEAMARIAAEQGIDLARSYAYSDSATDLPMLEAVGHPVVVNPDRELAKTAKQREWEVRTFVRPVRLRDRVPTPPLGRAGVVGGGVTAIAAGAAIWAWTRRRRQTDAPDVAGLARLVREVSRQATELRRTRPVRASWPRQRRGRGR